MKTAVFPVYKFTRENPLKPPPALCIFLFGLVSRTKAVTRRSLVGLPGCPLHPEHRQKLLDGISCRHLLSQLSTHKPKELASQKTKDKTQNVKRATVFTCSEITIFFTATPSGKVLLDIHQMSSKCQRLGMLCFSFIGRGNVKRKWAQFSRTKLTYIHIGVSKHQHQANCFLKSPV